LARNWEPWTIKKENPSTRRNQRANKGAVFPTKYVIAKGRSLLRAERMRGGFWRESSEKRRKGKTRPRGFKGVSQKKGFCIGAEKLALALIRGIRRIGGGGCILNMSKNQGPGRPLNFPCKNHQLRKRPVDGRGLIKIN